jgi:hypothetical protein
VDWRFNFAKEEDDESGPSILHCSACL